jgi:hypothetical protein
MRLFADYRARGVAQPERLKPIRAEFQRRTRGFTYRSGVPAGKKPPERLDH